MHAFLFSFIYLFLSLPEDIFICFLGEREREGEKGKEEGREKNIDAKEVSNGCLPMHPDQKSTPGQGTVCAPGTADEPTS